MFFNAFLYVCLCDYSLLESSWLYLIETSQTATDPVLLACSKPNVKKFPLTCLILSVGKWASALPSLSTSSFSYISRMFLLFINPYCAFSSPLAHRLFHPRIRPRHDNSAFDHNGGFALFAAALTPDLVSQRDCCVTEAFFCWLWEVAQLNMSLALTVCHYTYRVTESQARDEILCNSSSAVVKKHGLTQLKLIKLWVSKGR